MNAEDSLAHNWFASGGRDPALQRHPNWEACYYLEEDDAKRPHVKAPGMTSFTQIHGCGQVALRILASLFQVFKNLWRKILGRSRSDLGDVMELESWTEVDQLDALDVIFILVELNQNVIGFDVGVDDAKSG